MLSEEAKEARRAYKRAWNKANPDRVRAAQARYWEKKAREMTEEQPANESTSQQPDTGR